MNKNFQIKRGFTLVELLIVITIIMVLVTVGMMSYANAQKVGRDARRKADLKQVQAALEMFRADNGFYPQNKTGNLSVLSTDLVTKYTQKLPPDPSASSNYYFVSDLTGLTYTICANLENDKDAEYIPAGPLRDPACGTYNYVVKNP